MGIEHMEIPSCDDEDEEGCDEPEAPKPCMVCGWVDDGSELLDTSEMKLIRRSGYGEVLLNLDYALYEARENFKRHGHMHRPTETSRPEEPAMDALAGELRLLCDALAEDGGPPDNDAVMRRIAWIAGPREG